MKRLLILMILGMLLGSTAGCKFWDCLWHGPAYRQPCQPVAGPCATPCTPPCNSCTSGPAIPAATPGPITYTSPVGPTQ
jgi:hypothetical protein